MPSTAVTGGAKGKKPKGKKGKKGKKGGGLSDLTVAQLSKKASNMGIPLSKDGVKKPKASLIRSIQKKA